MTTKDQSLHSFIGVDELEDRMVILSYLGFHDKYRQIDERLCMWIKHNFNGVAIQAVRKNQTVHLRSKELRPGDTVLKFHKFPNSLKKLTFVNRALVKELKARGFVRFEVRKGAQSLIPKQKEIGKVNHLIRNIKKGAEQRERGSAIIENLLDRAREGNTDTSELVGYIKNVSADSSIEAITAIVSLKESDQTYAHCIDVGAIFLTAYYKIIKRKGRRSIFKNEEEALFAGFLHDFGKFKVPKNILDSTTRFSRDSKEMQEMFKHPIYSKEILSEMGLPDYIVNMAYLHHVKADPSMKSSYPEVSSYDEVLYETRLLAIIDVYQALVGKRSYKKSWTPPSAIQYIDTLAGVEYDLEAWEDFLSVTGKYPIGSLVKLNDDTTAFVVTVPERDLHSPCVVRVLDGGGDNITDYALTDLRHDSVTIVGDLDCTEVFGVRGVEVFSGLQID